MGGAPPGWPQAVLGALHQLPEAVLPGIEKRMGPNYPRLSSACISITDRER